MGRKNKKPNRSQRRQYMRDQESFEYTGKPKNYDPWPEASNFNKAIESPNKGFAQGQRAIKQVSHSAKKKSWQVKTADSQDIWAIADKIFGTNYYWFRKDKEYVTTDSERRGIGNLGSDPS